MFWTELAPIREPGLVLETVGRSIGATGPLAEHVGEREMLLLVDNVEQVIDAGPGLADVVEACPNLKVLVTSRELLRVRGEVEYPVVPLAHPEAVQLFCARAQVEPTEDVAELCAHLDNLPLAIELAAARAKVLTPPQILERLAGRLDLFRGGRDADPRQATLRGTIEWSHDLLSEQERRLFARLGVFVGDYAFEAAESICDAGLDSLQSLVEKSLVRRTDQRFWMLETIREFAVERLEASGEADEIRGRYVEYFFELAGQANLWSDAEGPQRHELIEPEQDNVRAALDHALAGGDLDRAAQLAIRLENFLIMHNPFEAIRRVETLLDTGAALSEDTRARLLRELGGALHMTGDPERAMRATQESLALFRRHHDDAGVSESLNRLAASAIMIGDPDRARALVIEALEIGRRTDRPRLEAVNIGMLGQIECMQGNADLGLEMLERSATIAAAIGFVWWQGVMLGIAAEFALRLGRVEQAERWQRTSLDVLREAGDRQNMVYSLALFAWIAAVQGDRNRAGALWGAIESEEARGPVGAWAAERDQYEAEVARAAGPEFDEGRRRGRGLTLREAVEFALEDDPSGGTI
ncbi:MAG TPA: hypothetical protein VKA30_01595 [Actinomycetota bacterium]|nr:hypothetical protein [Actinomycetota bacterium]